MGRSPRYWICAYANNQHQLYRELSTTNLMEEDPVASVEQTSFVRAMKLSQGTLVVVDKEGQCFSRLWCVYEIYSSLVGRDQRMNRQDLYIEDDDTPAWSIFGKSRQYYFDLYTAVRNKARLSAVGITDGIVAVDSNSETKWDRESTFPVDCLKHGMLFDCRAGKASMKEDEVRIHKAIGDDQTLLNRWVHGVIAASVLRRALESDDSKIAEGVLRSIELGKVRKLSFFMGGSLADKPETIDRVLNTLDSEACCLLDLQSDSLEYLPPDFGRFQNLRHLCLAGCSSLRLLPQSFVELRSLSAILMQFLPKLECLPDSLGNLKSLTKISLDSCTSLTRLPESIGKLSKLSRLYLTDCSSLEELPESVAELRELEVIHLNRCYGLKKLPERLGNLKSLEDLQLEHCRALTNLPKSMEDLGALRRLNLWHCTSLRNLPKLKLPSLIALQTSGVDSKLIAGWEASGREYFVLT